jgi:hypothetical protein
LLSVVGRWRVTMGRFMIAACAVYVELFVVT